MSTVFIAAINNDSTLLCFLNNLDRPMKFLELAVRSRTWLKFLSFVVLKCLNCCLIVCFFRNGPPVQYRKVTGESASQAISVRHFTGSQACHIINEYYYLYKTQTSYINIHNYFLSLIVT